MRLIAILGFVVAACGSSGSKSKIDAKGSGDASQADAKQPDAPASPATVNGNLGGSPLSARDAIWNTGTASGFDFTMTSTWILISEYPGACNVQSTHVGVPNTRILAFVLAANDGAGDSTPITAPGTYTILPSGGTPAANSMEAQAYFEVDGATCLRTSFAFGMTGSVTVTSATDPQQATFDVTFDNGDHVTGSYKAMQCTSLDVNATPTC